MYIEQPAPALELPGGSRAQVTRASQRACRIWIDLDNTPHVPFFKPIVRELEKRGYSVLLTARDAFQVWELAQHLGLKCRKVGRHYGKNRLLKLCGLGWRALQLAPTALHRPKLALSHGSRSQTLIANLCGIPTIGLDDYEHSTYLPLARPKWLLVPQAIRGGAVQHFSTRVRHYSGIKEDVYAAEFVPDPSIIARLGLHGEDIIVTVRPPATQAHYHRAESDVLFVSFMERVLATPGIRAVLLPRNKEQESEIRNQWPKWFAGNKILVPGSAVDGLNLVWHSDLVVSGGGTMNREAAALGVPVYSIFRGRIGAVDQELAQSKRLILIESVDDVCQKIEFRKRSKEKGAESALRKALGDIVSHIEDILWKYRAA